MLRPLSIRTSTEAYAGFLQGTIRPSHIRPASACSSHHPSQHMLSRTQLVAGHLRNVSSQLPRTSTSTSKISSSSSTRNMSNSSSDTNAFDLPNTSPTVKVTLTPDLSRDDLLNFPAFKTWISTLKQSLTQQTEQKDHVFHKSPYILRSITVQSVDWFGKSKLGFVKLRAEVSNDDGEKLPGSVFLRGGSVAMLLILQPDDVPATSETDKHVLLTVQPRVPAGSLSFVEIPAGMLDDSGTFSGAAMTEIREETGLKVTEDELTDLSKLAFEATNNPLSKIQSGETLQAATYPSAGGSDEFVPVFLAQKRVPRGELDSWRGRLTGLRDEGEKITLTLCRLEELWKVGARDAKALAAWALYNGLKGEGKI